MIIHAEMMRRIQQKEVIAKKEQEKAAVKEAADSESKSEQVDLQELERIRKRQAGTQVTVESFMAWKAAFDEEMRQQALAQKFQALGGTAAALAKHDLLEDGLLSRATGKQLFLMNKAGVEDQEVEALIAAGEAEELVDEDEEDDDDDEDYVEGEDGEEDDDDDDDDDEDGDWRDES